jgi:hypothetical protein
MMNLIRGSNCRVALRGHPFDDTPKTLGMGGHGGPPLQLLSQRQKPAPQLFQVERVGYESCYFGVICGPAFPHRIGPVLHNPDVIFS